MKNKYLLSLLCGTALICQAGTAFAQAQLEEVVVTARKREETLLSVPVAVTAVSAAALKSGFATDLTKMAELAPQVAIGQGGSGTGGIISVRGIGSLTSDAGIDQTVATEIDGVPMSRGQIVSTSLYDISAVQILKGPQALFFGKNSPAGVISIHSQDPTDTFGGYVTGGYEFKAAQRFVEGAINAPITDDFKMRAAFRMSAMDGWLKNNAVPMQSPAPFDTSVTLPGASHSAYGDQSYGFRLGMLWTPGDDFEAKFKLELNNLRKDSAFANLEGICINGQTTPTFSTIYPQAGGPLFGIAASGLVTGPAVTDCNRDLNTATSDVPAKYAVNYPNANNGHPYVLSKFILASLNLSKKLDKFSVTSATGYFNQQYKSLGVSDLSYASIWSTNNDRYRLITEELRVNTSFDGALNGSVGAYYEHSTRPYQNTPDLYHFFDPVAQNYASVNLVSKTTGSFFSVFGQLRYNITPELELAGGARYSHDKKATDMVNTSVGPLGATLFNLRPVGSPLNPRYSNNNVSPEVTLTWHPDQHQTLYAAFKTGYKGGGISNPFLVNKTFTNTNLLFKPEKIKGFEAGYKAELMNRTLRVEMNAYRYIYSNLQVVSYDATVISFTLLNAAKARIQGVEGSFEWLATDDLTFHGAFGFNDGKYLSFTNAQCYGGQTLATGCIPASATVGAHQDLSGKPLQRANKLSFNLGGEYKAHMGAWDATFGLSGSHTGSYNAASNYSPGGVQAAYWLLNASVRVGPADGRYELAFIGRNLTNSLYMLQVNDWTLRASTNQFFVYNNRPREAVIQVTAHF